MCRERLSLPTAPATALESAACGPVSRMDAEVDERNGVIGVDVVGL